MGIGTQKSGRMNVSDHKDKGERFELHRDSHPNELATNCDIERPEQMHHGKKPSLSGFTFPAAKGADGYRSAGHVKDGVLRNSGKSGAHRIGKK